MNGSLGPGNNAPLALIQGGGGPPGGGMELRVTELEKQAAVTDAKLTSIENTLERMERNQLTQWDVAKVVFYVVGVLMAAAIFGPRLVSVITP